MVSKGGRRFWVVKTHERRKCCYLVVVPSPFPSVNAEVLMENNSF